MATDVQRATLEDLQRFDGRAELIDGRIVEIMASGDLPAAAAGEIYVSLRAHTKTTRRGHARPDGVGCAVGTLASGRESFQPDASFYDGPLPADRMRFIQGPPTFAAEVRSENDYGPLAELELAAKRGDYFEAGTLVVWDVDPVNECVRVYRRDRPEQPDTFRRGQEAHAEPAIPDWRIAVDAIFG